jgi:hypothetical protein
MSSPYGEQPVSADPAPPPPFSTAPYGSPPPYPPQGGYAAAQGGYAAPYPYGYPVAPDGNGLAVAGLVCGIISVVLFWVPFLGWVLAALGIIFGGIGLAKANKGAPNKGMAIAGLVCGIVSVLAWAVIIAVAAGSTTF